jgi:hypothetical protein
MNDRKNKAQELDEQIKLLASECRLDAWTAFVDEMAVPGDMYPALASGRPELLKLIQPRAMTADEAKPLFDIIASLIATNMALREHAEQLALFAHNWADAFKALHSVGERIERFAKFEHRDYDDEAAA